MKKRKVANGLTFYSLTEVSRVSGFHVNDIRAAVIDTKAVMWGVAGVCYVFRGSDLPEIKRVTRDFVERHGSSSQRFFKTAKTTASRIDDMEKMLERLINNIPS